MDEVAGRERSDIRFQEAGALSKADSTSAGSTGKPVKPSKPSPDFPLFPHALAMSPAAVVVSGAGLVIWSPLLLVLAVAAAKERLQRVAEELAGRTWLAVARLTHGVERMAAVQVLTGTNGIALRSAHHGGCRVLAYAEGGYSVTRHVPGIGWTLLAAEESAPEETEWALCCALGIAFQA